MNVATRVSVFVGFLSLAGLGVCATRPESVIGWPGEITGMRDAEQSIRQEEQAAQDLDRRSRVVRRRMDERRAIALEVADGTWTLHGAAARFRVLNAEAPDCSDAFRLGFPGRSEEERLCRQVIAWTYTVLVNDSPIRAEVVTGRLRAELERELAETGTVRLPESDADSPTGPSPEAPVVP